MFYILNLGDIGDTIAQALRSLMGNILALLYTLIENLYTVFIHLSRAEILDNDFVQSIYNKVGMILGIFMIFKLVFSLIQALIDPDKLTDKQKGFTAIISRSVIAIVLLGLTPGIFREAFNLQNAIVGDDNNQNVIYKLIAGKNVKGNFTDMGRVLASDLYFSFFSDNETPLLNRGTLDSIDENTSSGTYHDRFETDNYKNLEERVTKKEDGATFYDTVDYLTVKTNNKYVIEFDWFLSLCMACFVIWMFIMYCIQIGARVIQLAYLQLIAPVPILSYISNPEGSFKKWINQCITTYLDLFIRLAIIYFVMTLIGDVLSQFKVADSQIMTSTGLDINTDKGMLVLLKTFIVIGLLIFAKKVPELLKDLFPNLGGGAASFSFGLKPPKEVTGLATLGAGVAVGGIAGMASGLRHGEGLRGKLAGATGGFFRGAASARTKGNVFGNAKKGMANVRAANARAYERHHDGSTLFGRMAPVHAERKVADYDRAIENAKQYQSINDSVKKELAKDERVMLAQSKLDALLKSGTITKTEKVSLNGKPVMGSNGKQLERTVTRNITAADITAARDKIKAAEKEALADKIASKDSTIMTYLKAAENNRINGKQSDIVNFGDTSLVDESKSAEERAQAFFDNAKSSKEDIISINTPGTEQNKEYEKVKANAKYKHKDK